MKVEEDDEGYPSNEELESLIFETLLGLENCLRGYLDGSVAKQTLSNILDKLTEFRTLKSVYTWDENLDQDALCECGHPYYRHFDTYDYMRHVGCKYCQCHVFRKAENDLSRL